MDEKNNCEKATFIVDIKNRENHSWQGTSTWVDTNKEICFRSALELIKIIDSTMPGDEND